MAMDNRSIAAFIETNRTKMNSVIICLPSKGAGREKRTNTKYTTTTTTSLFLTLNIQISQKILQKKWTDQGKEVGVKRSF